MNEPTPNPVSTPQPEPPPPRRRRHGWRWVGWLVAGLLVVPLLLALALYAALRSPLLERALWPRLQPIVAEQTGFEVDLERLRFDLRGALLAEGVVVRQASAEPPFCAAPELALGRLRIEFRLWPLRDEHLHVDLIELRDLDLRACLEVATAAAPPADPAAPPAEVDLETLFAPLIELLEAPPLRVDLEQLRVAGVNADLELRLPDAGVELTWRGGGELEAAVQWRREALIGSLASRWESLAPLRVKRRGAERLDWAVAPQLDFALGVSLTEREAWQLELDPLRFELQLNESTLAVAAEQGEWAVHTAWPGYRLALAPESRLAATLAESWPLRVDLALSSRWTDAELDLAVLPASRLTALLDHQFDLDVVGALDLLAPSLARLTVAVGGEQSVGRMALAHDGDAFASEAVRLGVEAGYRPGGGSAQTARSAEAGDGYHLALDLALEQLATPWLAAAVDLQPRIELRAGNDLRRVTLDSEVVLDRQRLLHAALRVEDDDQRLRLMPAVTLSVPQRLAATLPQADLLYRLGDLELRLDGSGHWIHHHAGVTAIDWEQLGPWQLQSDLALTVAQRAPPQAEAEALHLDGPLRIALESDSTYPAGRHQLAVRVASDGLYYPPLQQPLPLTAAVASVFDEAPFAGSLNGSVRLATAPFLDWQLDFADRPQQAELRGTLDLLATPEWQRYLAALDALEAFGEVDLTTRFALALDHPQASVTTLDPAAVDRLGAVLELDGRLAQGAIGGDARLHLKEPVTFAMQAAGEGAQASASVTGRYRLPALAVRSAPGGADWLRLRGVEIDWGLSGGWAGPLSSRFDVAVRGEQLALHRPAAEHADGYDNAAPQLADGGEEAGDVATGHHGAGNSDADEWVDFGRLALPLRLVADAEFDLDDQLLSLHQLDLALGDGWLTHRLSGRAQLEAQSAALSGALDVTPRPNLFAGVVDGLEAGGRLRLPWEGSVVDGRRLALSAVADFDDFSLEQSAAGVSGVSGEVRIDQALELLGDGRLAFAHLLTANPFQRVDFNRVEPYLDDRRNFRIAELRLDDWTVGPLEATLPIEQNLIRLQHFTLRLFGGELAGQFYLDATPGAWSLGLLGRVSRVDLRHLLPERLGQSDYAPVNARTALEFDFEERRLEGRIDITDINRAQLLQLLDLIDPEQQDRSLSTVRSALRLAHPQWVRVEMARGLMDLRVALSTFRDPIHVHGLPLTPIIERFGEEALQLPNSVPLE